MKKMLIISVLITALICAGCKSTEATVNVSSTEQAVSSQIEVSSIPTSSEVSSEVSSETPSSVSTSSESVTSVPGSSAATSKAPKAESKEPVSSKAPTSSQTPKPTSKPITEDKPNFGDLMDEAVVDAIIAEGIEYANSKGMTWKDDYTVDGNGYYNPAFSGHGEEAFRRDLFYHIDQLYDINLADNYYVDGNPIYYKIVKGEFHEKGYWYGYVLY